MIKVSIITPSYNRAGMIETAIRSVLDQNYPDVEHIIIDGGSTDGTLDLLKKYPHLQVVSEPDQGMYDALNKGLRMTTGEIIGFLNTDDFYEPNIFLKITQTFTERKVDAVVGTSKFFQERSDGSRNYFYQSPIPLKSHFWNDLTLGNPYFNAWFFRKTVFDILGNFDASYKIAGDREFLLRFALSGLNYEILSETIYHYCYHSGSLSMNQDRAQGIKVNRENLHLVDHILEDPRLPEIGCKQLRRLQTRETITAASRSLLTKNWKQAKSYSLLGFRFDHLWPLKFVVHSLTGIFRRLIGRIWVITPKI